MPYPVGNCEEFNQLKHDTESIRQMTDEYLLKIFEAVKSEIVKRKLIIPQIKAKFEGAFGVDQNSRTPAQWRKLVKKYGIDAVVQLESMTMEEVTNRCTESFSKSLCRSLKKTRH